MAKVITLGLQKGGVSKTTTTGILAHLFSKDKKKVLAVDMDSQGNLTELLTDVPANEFIDRSVLEAIAYKQPEKYIYKVNEYLDILPANNFLALLGRWMYTKRLPNSEEIIDFTGQPYEQLDIILNMIRDQYDYIIIDTPPSLSEQTTNALIASDYVIVLYESSKFCYSAVPNFMDTLSFAQSKSRHKPKV
ncbi:ParA family protein, partial [Butyricicoccus sp. 1XD8-22]